MKRNDQNITVTPQIGCDKSGGLTGGGVIISRDEGTYSGSAGFFKTTGGTVFSGSIDRKVSDSLSVGMGGSVDTHGKYDVGAKVEYKFD